MPDISLPEVRLKGKLPEGLRDLTIEDIQKAIPDLHLPSGGDARKAGKDARKAAERTARDARKSVSREASKAAKAVENALPRRRGPNPVPVAILAMLGGVVVGWLLSSNPLTGPRIQAALADARARLDEWRGRGTETFDDEWDTTDAQAYPDSLRTPVASEPYTGTTSGSDLGSEPYTATASASDLGTSGETAGLGDTVGTTDQDSTDATDSSRTTNI